MVLQEKLAKIGAKNQTCFAKDSQINHPKILSSWTWKDQSNLAKSCVYRQGEEIDKFASQDCEFRFFFSILESPNLRTEICNFSKVIMQLRGQQRVGQSLFRQKTFCRNLNFGECRVRVKISYLQLLHLWSRCVAKDKLLLFKVRPFQWKAGFLEKVHVRFISFLGRLDDSWFHD